MSSPIQVTSAQDLLPFIDQHVRLTVTRPDMSRMWQHYGQIQAFTEAVDPVTAKVVGMTVFMYGEKDSEGIVWSWEGDAQVHVTVSPLFEQPVSDPPDEVRVLDYFRKPDVLGEEVCNTCFEVMHEHGWIDLGDRGIIVCPGTEGPFGGQTVTERGRAAIIADPAEGGVDVDEETGDGDGADDTAEDGDPGVWGESTSGESYIPLGTSERALAMMKEIRDGLASITSPGSVTVNVGPSGLPYNAPTNGGSVDGMSVRDLDALLDLRGVVSLGTPIFSCPVCGDPWETVQTCGHAEAVRRKITRTTQPYRDAIRRLSANARPSPIAGRPTVNQDDISALRSILDDLGSE